MDVQKFRRRLLDLERQLSARTIRAQGNARAQAEERPRDAGDASRADEAQSEAFTESALDGMVLQQVRDALRRLDDGSFGLCVVDGAPIAETRLEAVPWTPYCLEHQHLLEGSARPRSTL